MYSSPEVDHYPVRHSRHGTRVGHSPHQYDSTHTLVVLARVVLGGGFSDRD